jgi:hypothetical protein
MSKYTIEPEFKGWTIDELQVAITTLEHDLRGSWAECYKNRIWELDSLCEAMVLTFERADKQTFIKLLQSGYDYADMANFDMVVAAQELEGGEYDGRVFRDCATFYDVELNKKGKTQQVADWLELNTVCDEWHWFQREEVTENG